MNDKLIFEHVNFERSSNLNIIATTLRLALCTVILQLITLLAIIVGIQMVTAELCNDTTVACKYNEILQNIARYLHSLHRLAGL